MWKTETKDGKTCYTFSVYQNSKNVEVLFRVPSNLKFSKVITSFCQRQGLSPNFISVEVDGYPLLDMDIECEILRDTEIIVYS